MPYAIIKIDDGSVVQRFGSLPKSFDVVLPGQIKSRRIVSPVAVGDEGLGYRFVEVTEVSFDRPGPYYTPQEPDVEVLDGNMLTITRSWTAWTQTEIDAFEGARKDATANQFDNVDDVLRAAVLVIGDESNRHAAAISAILAAAAAATTLANFKSAMALIQAPAQRTTAQLKTAIRAKLGNGI